MNVSIVYKQHCNEFVWNKTQDKISIKTAHKSVQKGGLGLPHLKTFISALKLTWIRKFMNTNHEWKSPGMAGWLSGWSVELESQRSRVRISSGAQETNIPSQKVVLTR